MAKGSVLPGEVVARRDPETGVRLWQVTNDASINHNFYFLTPSMTPDGASVLFASNRGGATNFYQAGFPQGDIRQLTDGDEIHGYSATLGGNGATLYFTQGGEVRALDMASLEERVLADFGAASLGECSLNATESLLVTALKRDGAFHLAVIATDGTDSRIIKTSERTLIHPQFHPSQADLIAYSSDPAPRMRMIRADGSGDELLWQHGNDEFIVHETFLGEDELILVRWPYALQRFSLASRQMTEVAAFNAWHIVPTRDGRYLVADTVHPDIGLQLVSLESGLKTTLCLPQSSSQGSQWRHDRYAEASAWAPKEEDDGAERDALSWMEIGTDTVYGPQWSHPHPAWSHDERYVVYTSDHDGAPQVHVAEVPERLLNDLIGSSAAGSGAAAR
jgi:hypothetical protein